MTDTSKDELQDNLPAAASPGADAATSPDVGEPLAAARTEAAASHERYLRAVADLENFRKRSLREKEELRQAATAGVLDDIIPILDNLALGQAAAKAQTDVRAVADGIGLVIGQLQSALARHGLKEINPAGAAFDPHLHECIAHQPDPAVPAETVSQVVRLGYLLNGRLLRPASVIVSSGPPRRGAATH